MKFCIKTLKTMMMTTMTMMKMKRMRGPLGILGIHSRHTYRNTYIHSYHTIDKLLRILMHTNMHIYHIMHTQAVAISCMLHLGQPNHH